MSLLHILNAVDPNAQPNLYRAVCHIPTSTGTNSAGMLWTDVVINSGLNITSLSVGTGAGQISSSEKADIDAGRVTEVHVTIMDNPTLASSLRLAFIDSQTATVVSEIQANYARQYRWYGLTRG